MARWGFLTNHARVLLCIAHDPGARLRDIAASLGITERSAHAIVTDLTAAGYVIKHKDGRRNRYQIQAHLPLPQPATHEPAIGDVLPLLAGPGPRPQPSPPASVPSDATKAAGGVRAAAVGTEATVVRGFLLPAASPCRGAVLLRVRDATMARGSPKPRRTNRTTAPSRRTGRSVPSCTMQKAYPAPLIIGREDVDCASGPASEVLAWYGRRV